MKLFTSYMMFAQKQSRLGCSTPPGVLLQHDYSYGTSDTLNYHARDHTHQIKII